MPHESRLNKTKDGFFRGLGWAFGVTVGFVLISTIFIFVFQQLGGLPVIGKWIASVVEQTQVQLYSRTPVFNSKNQVEYKGP